MSQRPMTSKPRGVCVYYRSTTGCRNGDSCKFLHGDGETLSPYDRSKTCKFYASGFCKHGDKCWFRHAFEQTDVIHNEAVFSSNDGTRSEIAREDSDAVCSICQERPVTYGLLEDCSHVFCLKCIRGWRDPNGKTHDIIESGNTKRCPYCRTSSKFVTPSSKFYPKGDPLKQVTIANYKASMARIPCKYFVRSSPGARYCPFGKDCFYQHKERDGAPYVFEHGAGHYLKKLRRRQSRALDQSILDLFASVGRRAFVNDVAVALVDTRSPEARSHEGAEDDEYEYDEGHNEYDPELTDLLSNAIARFGGALNLDTYSVDDEHLDDVQTPVYRPSIFATPESSALPFTRAFVDNNMLAEDDYFLMGVESDEDDDSAGTASDRTLLFRTGTRRPSISDFATSWPSDLDDALIRDSVIGSGNTVHTLQDQSRPRVADEDQERSVLAGTAPSTTLQMAVSPIVPVSPPPVDAISTESITGFRTSEPPDSRSSGNDHSHRESESRHKQDTRPELSPRRTKLTNNGNACAGRRNGGQTFVTDGRGRVVATDDWAYTDGASQAFGVNSLFPPAPPPESRNETDAPASVGQGALDDLD